MTGSSMFNRESIMSELNLMFNEQGVQPTRDAFMIGQQPDDVTKTTGYDFGRPAANEESYSPQGSEFKSPPPAFTA